MPSQSFESLKAPTKLNLCYNPQLHLPLRYFMTSICGPVLFIGQRMLLEQEHGERLTALPDSVDYISLNNPSDKAN